MPITARCPYCRQWKVRAPDHALGQSVTCKKCQNSFTVVETEQAAPMPTALHPSALGVKPDRKPDPPATVCDAPPAPDESSREPQLDPTPEAQVPDEPSADALEPEFAPPARRRHERSFPIALVAMMAGGIGLALSQTGLAHYAAAGGAALGLLLAIVSLALVQRKWLIPIAATGLNLLVLGIVIALPTWLNLRSWRQPKEHDVSTTVLAMGHDGVAVPAGEWVDANTSSWQLGQVRVSVGRVVVAPVELAGPEGKKRLPRESYVQIRVRVKNVGVFGAVSLQDWAPDSIRLTDSSGTGYARKTFEPGWEPSGRVAPAKLKPSESDECLLFFDAVPTNVSYLRLELPGEAFGAPGVVRLQIPILMIQFRTTH